DEGPAVTGQVGERAVQGDGPEREDDRQHDAEGQGVEERAGLHGAGSWKWTVSWIAQPRCSAPAVRRTAGARSLCSSSARREAGSAARRRGVERKMVEPMRP